MADGAKPRAVTIWGKAIALPVQAKSISAQQVINALRSAESDGYADLPVANFTATSHRRSAA